MTELSSVVEHHLDALALPGAAVAVVRSGRPTEVVCRGLADVASRQAVDEATQFRIGSITKTMTTLLVLRLVECGRVGLDDPVEDHVAVRISQPAGARAITVRDLLTHRSGLGEIASWSALRHPMWAIGGCDPDRPPPTLAELAAAGYRAETAPGEKWVYANPGFTLLGRLVEAVSGQRFAELLSERVFAPTGMETATLDPRHAPHLAVGHKHRDGAFEPVRRFGVATVSAGGVIASIGDLAAYAAMLLDGGQGSGGRVVDPPTLAEAFAVQFQPHPSLRGIGLTFRIRGSDGPLLIGHNGSMPGWNAGLVLCPDRGIAAVALTNRAVAPSAEFGGGRLALAALDTARPHRSTVSPAPQPAVPGPDLDHLAGTYRPSPGRLTNVRAYVLFGGALHIRRVGEALEAKGRSGPMATSRPLQADEARSEVFHLDLDGVDLPLAFDKADGGPCPHLWLDGIPTGFSLHRSDARTRRRVLAGVAGFAALSASALIVRSRRGRATQTR